jgi:hypothetical protein
MFVGSAVYSLKRRVLHRCSGFVVHFHVLSEFVGSREFFVADFADVADAVWVGFAGFDVSVDPVLRVDSVAELAGKEGECWEGLATFLVLRWLVFFLDKFRCARRTIFVCGLKDCSEMSRDKRLKLTK